MVDDFYENLTALTDNLSDIVFSRYAEVTKVDGFSVECKENESGVVHIDVPLVNNFEVEVGDFIILGFVDNDLYNPVALGMLEPRGGGGGDVPIVTAWEQTLSDSKVPSEKLTKNTLDIKVDKETGKGLSTEDYTSVEKSKLAGIEAGANLTVVDSNLSSTSENPVQNKVVKGSLDLKANSADLATVATTGDYDDLTNKLEVVDDLTTADPNKPLSAKQGKILKELIDSLLPTVASVTLSADKSVLSAFDSDSATLTATALNSQSHPVEGVTVTFYKGATSLGTATTNSNGVATKTYNSNGEGVLSFTAEAETKQSTAVQITDYIYVDTAQTDHSSRYIVITASDFGSGTIEYDSTNSDYTIKTSSTCICGFSMADINGLTDFNITMDFKIVSAYNNRQIGIGAMDTSSTKKISSRYESSLSKFTIWRNDGGSSFINLNHSLSDSTYYKLQFIKSGNDYTLKVYNDSGSLLNETTGTDTVFDNVSTLKPFIFIAYNRGMTFKFKNLKIY